MKLTIAEPKYLKDTISIISELVSEATFKIDKNGMGLVAMDPANVSMVLFNLFSSAFVEYKVEEPTDLGINLSNLKQILRRANPSDMISLSTVGKGKLKVLFSGQTKRQFFLPIIDIDQEEQKIPDLKFQAELTLNSKILADAIDDVDIVSDSLIIEVDKEHLVIRGEGDLSQSETEIPAGEDVSITLEGADKVKASYSVEYLKKMMNAAKISDKCKLKFGNDWPMKLEFNEVDKISLAFVLAPRFEYD